MVLSAFLLYHSFRSSDVPYLFSSGLSHSVSLHPPRPKPRFWCPPRLRVVDESEDDWPEPTLEESFDAIDDVYLERPPGKGRDKVKVFGAWLDADVAGRKAGQGNRAAALIERAERGEKLTSQEQAEVFYEQAIANMRRGMYDTSYEMLEKAVTLAGEDSRRGGEFKLWAVQALQSVGRDEQAAELLRSMKNHSDRDVRMVSSELLFIAEAPRLELSKEDYVPMSGMSYTPKTSEKSTSKKVTTSVSSKKWDNSSSVTSAETDMLEGLAPALSAAFACAALTLGYVLMTSQ